MRTFSTPPKSWDDIFRLIQEVPRGRETLILFRNQVASGLVQVQSYPDSVKNQLRALNSPTQGPLQTSETLTFDPQKSSSDPTLTPLGAAFVTDGFEGKLVLDPTGPLGIVVPFLFHEMIHSLDETLWRAAQRGGSPTERRAIIFESECRAFRAQHKFQEELRSKYPEYRSFCETWGEQFPFIQREFLPDEIAKLYF